VQARQRPGSIGARLFKQLGRGGRSTPTGSPAEFGQALGDPLSLFSLMGVVPDQDEPKDLGMLGLRRASVLGRPHAQAAYNIVIKVANRERRHRQWPLLSGAAITAWLLSCESNAEPRAVPASGDRGLVSVTAFYILWTKRIRDAILG